jgi:hypothetical protein
MAENVRPRNEDVLVVLLASGATNAEATEGSGFTERTVYRRLQDDNFRQRIEQARRTFTQRALDRLLSLRLKHIEHISRLAAADPLPADPDELARARADLAPHAVRLAASKAVVELGSKLLSEHELERRLRAVEEWLTALGQGGAP